MEDFSDLEAIGSAIGEKRIVLLGEQSHGDRLTMAAKSRLIKYLYLKKGFDVVLFEADFFALHQLTQQPLPTIKAAIYPFWSQTAVMEAFWTFVANTQNSNRPIEIAGIDTRFYANYSKQQLIPQLDHLLQRFHPSYLQKANYQSFKTILQDLLKNEYAAKHSKKEQATFRNTLAELKELLPKEAFWLQVFHNLGKASYAIWNPYYFSYREKTMGDNFNWLMDNYFPQRKVILWAHNQHILKDRAITLPFFEQYQEQADTLLQKDFFTEAGAEISKKWKSEVYSIAFISYDGQHSNFVDAVTHPSNFVMDQFLKHLPIPPASAQSLEYQLAQQQKEYLFLPLQHLKVPTYTAKVLSYYPPFEIKTQWNKGFDAFFFIRTMEGFKQD